MKNQVQRIWSIKMQFMHCFDDQIHYNFIVIKENF